MPPKLKTSELLHNLCTQLSHSDAINVCVKKVVHEHWLDNAEELKDVPKQRLEKWGLPLKLVDEIFDFLYEHDANANLSGIKYYVNYTIRPALAGSTPFRALNKLNDDRARRENPEEWAARKLQGRFRCRQYWRAKQKDDVLDMLDARDFSRKSPEEAYQLRKKRAEEKLRRMVRRWRYNRAARLANAGAETAIASAGRSPDGDAAAGGAAATSQTGCKSAAERLTATKSAVSANYIMDHLAQASQGVVRDCEVTDMLRTIGEELDHEEDMEPIIHRLVTINWLEDADDLELVEDRHWDTWQIPEKVVLKIKAQLLQRTQGNFSAFTGRVSSSFWGLFGYPAAGEQEEEGGGDGNEKKGDDDGGGRGRRRAGRGQQKSSATNSKE